VGSDSDLPIAKKATDFLSEFEITYSLAIASAHRTPDLLHDVVLHAEDSGTKVIIAVAGMAAHLPGVIASISTIPVIGVPVVSETSLGGLDALYSICQMPSGVPVATMAIGGAENAAIFATEILALENSSLQDKLKLFRKSMQEKGVAKNHKIKELGIDGYYKAKK
jgi:5-(carboxyamino)imidazole ribonucleotide mutase